MSKRVDFLLEFQGTLDSNGDYVSDWIDTFGVKSATLARFVQFTNPNITIEHSIDASNAFNSEAWNNTESKHLYARYFRLVVDAGTANSTFRVSIRVKEYL